jgi:hypothetical protein
MDKPRLPLTVPQSIWNDVCNAVSREFADSYLSGAEVIGNALLANTTLAYDRLNGSANATKAIRHAGLSLVRPPVFGEDEKRAILRADLANGLFLTKRNEPLSQEEYDILPIRRKIRHQLILADQAMIGWKSTTRQVDDDWRRRDAIAKNHRAEASRLGTMLEELI